MLESKPCCSEVPRERLEAGSHEEDERCRLDRRHRLPQEEEGSREDLCIERVHSLRNTKVHHIHYIFINSCLIEAEVHVQVRAFEIRFLKRDVVY